MSRSEWGRQDAEHTGKRGRHLASRAEQRVQREVKQTHRTSHRPQSFADKTRHKGPRQRDLEYSIEDFVDAVATSWQQKTEGWFERQSRKFQETSDAVGSEPLSNQRLRQRKHRKFQTKSKWDHRHWHRGKWHRHWKRRNRNGNLYRDAQNAKLCGVCSGLASYWNFAIWQVRLGVILGLVFIPALTIPAYFIAYFVMAAKPYYRRVTDRFQELDDEVSTRRKNTKSHNRNSKIKPDLTNAQLLIQAKQKFKDIEIKLRWMETYITSPRFEFQREFNRITGGRP